MPTYTNEELAELIRAQGDATNKRLDALEKQMDTFNDFMIVRLDREKQAKKKPDVAGVMKQALVVVGIALTIVLTIVSSFLQVTQQ